MTATLRNRLMLPADAAAVAAWLIARSTLEPEFEIELAPLLQRLIGEECVRGVVVENLRPTGGWHLVAVGMSGFAVQSVVDAHLATPKPFVFLEFLRRSVAREENVFLDPVQIGRANSGDGVDLVLTYLQGTWDFTSSFWRVVGEMIHGALVRHHRGYNMRRILHEDWKREADIYLAAGFEAFAQFDVTDAPNDPGDAMREPKRVLYYSDRTRNRDAAPGSSVSFLMNYVPPVCGLTRAEQRVLTHAIEGETDEEIAENLGVSPNTIKQVWRSVYGRLGDRIPFLFARPDDILLFAEGKRGPEKRRYAIAFLKDHLQELRPH